MTNSDQLSWLFSFGASNVTAKATKKGHMTFTFSGDDGTDMTAFTDRPDRLTGQLPLKRFARTFRKNFGDDYPNASMTSWKDGEFANSVFEITKFKHNGGDYHLKTDLLLDNFNQLKISSHAKKSGENVYFLPEASFFVDSVLSSIADIFVKSTGLGGTIGVAAKDTTCAVVTAENPSNVAVQEGCKAISPV